MVEIRRIIVTHRHNTYPSRQQFSNASIPVSAPLRTFFFCTCAHNGILPYLSYSRTLLEPPGRMLINLTISKPLGDAITFALAYQIPILVLAAMATDGGALFQICSLASVAFCGCVSTIWLCRRDNPTKLDLFMIKAGYLPTCVVTFYICHYVWSMKGYF